jgi:hypothetical protein
MKERMLREAPQPLEEELYMYYQNQRSWKYRHRPIHRVVFRIYLLLWLIPIVFFLAAPTLGGFLVTICIIIVICIIIAIWQGQKGVHEQRRVDYRESYRELSPPARLKQPLPSRYERGYQVEGTVRYDDYEQPHAQYPGQRP